MVFRVNSGLIDVLVPLELVALDRELQVTDRVVEAHDAPRPGAACWRRWVSLRASQPRERDRDLAREPGVRDDQVGVHAAGLPAGALVEC